MKLLFVCTGNICRSPTAEAIARARLSELGLDWLVDSAATTGWHAGEAPDPRTIEAGEQRGYALADLRAREVTPEDFDGFDVLIAMDDGHRAYLEGHPAAETSGALIVSLLDFADLPEGRDVPDPYYGEREGFERVIDVIEIGLDTLIAQLQR